MTRPPRLLVMVAYYAVVTATLLGVLVQLFPLVLPDWLSSRIGHNSEGLLLALVLALWIQFARPRLTDTRREWLVTGLVGAALVGLGLWLLATGLPSRFRTLNEPLLAAGLLVPYVQLRRPLPTGLTAGLAGAVLLGTVVFNRTALVTDLAEMLVALVLVVVALDLVDRGILDPTARRHRVVWVWYAFLVVAPLTFSVLEYHIGVSGLFGEVIRYAVRTTEVFLCLLLVELYFALGLRRRGSGRPAAVEPVRPLPVRA